MNVDYSSMASNSVLLAALLTPILAYLNRKIETYFLDLLALPFVMFMTTIVTSTAWPNAASLWLYVGGIVVEIVLYCFMAVEQFYVDRDRLTTKK